MFWNNGASHIAPIPLLLAPKSAPTKCSVKCLNDILGMILWTLDCGADLCIYGQHVKIKISAQIKDLDLGIQAFGFECKKA